MVVDAAGTYTLGTASDDGSVWYVDLNQDGDWDDADEHVIDHAATIPGINSLTGALPDSTVPGATYLRLRLTSQRAQARADEPVTDLVAPTKVRWVDERLLRQAFEAIKEVQQDNSQMEALQQIADTSGSYLLEVDYASLEEYLRNVASHKELSYLDVSDRDRRSVVSLGQAPRSRWPRKFSAGRVNI